MGVPQRSVSVQPVHTRKADRSQEKGREGQSQGQTETADYYSATATSGVDSSEPEVHDLEVRVAVAAGHDQVLGLQVPVSQKRGRGRHIHHHQLVEEREYRHVYICSAYMQECICRSVCMYSI